MMGSHKTNERKWSQRVTEKSNVLVLEKGVFTWDNPAKIAASLKQSALKSTRRKGSAYQSAMSMLNFYINRAGRNLDQGQKQVLIKAKEELRSLFKRKYSARI